MSISRPYPDIDLPVVSVDEQIFGWCTTTDLDRVAVIDADTGEQVTYGQLIGQVDAVAGALRARGVGVGDRVALHAPNSPEFVALFHGILRAGATVTPVNTLYTGEEVGRQLVDAGASFVITTAAGLEAMTAAVLKVGIDRRGIVVIDGAGTYPSFRELVDAGLAAPAVSFDPAVQLAVLPYSSGTTAAPKGVKLTHQNLVANVLQAAPLIGVRQEDTVMAVLPFFHIYGMTVLLNLTLFSGGRLVTMRRFDLEKYLTAIQKYESTYLFVAPPIALALARHPLIDAYDLSSVRAVLSGAAPLNESTAAEVGARLDARVLQGYGMTEMSPISHVVPFDRTDISSGSIGVAVPNLSCRLVDLNTGEDIPIPTSGVSAPGELRCLGPNIMAGYLGNDEATRDAFDEVGFLRTGDVATVAADGSFFIVDRLKELIKYHGFQVAPTELEAVLLTHPQVADAAVIGITSEDGEEIPKAFVVPVTGGNPTREDILDHVAARVAPHKKVREVEFIEQVPRSAAGKILRRQLREWAPAPSDPVVASVTASDPARS